LIDNTDCNIKVVCKFGNHGRTGEKIRISTGYKNSYEWMVYHFIAAEFE
jgi:rhodanese-related sulfurtransferase